MTDADLARWAADAMAGSAIGDRILALIAEVRRLRAEGERRAKRETAAVDGLTYYAGVLERDDD